VSDVAIRPVTPDQHDAVMHYFDMVAYADNPNWSKCFCMEKLFENYEGRTKAQNRAARSELIFSAKANGLVAYRLGRVVGWCHAAPKSELLEVPGERAADIGATAISKPAFTYIESGPTYCDQIHLAAFTSPSHG